MTPLWCIFHTRFLRDSYPVYNFNIKNKMILCHIIDCIDKIYFLADQGLLAMVSAIVASEW